MVRVTVRRLLRELQDAALDGVAIAHRLEASEMPVVRDAAELMARHQGRFARLLEEAVQQLRGSDGADRQLQLRLC